MNTFAIPLTIAAAIFIIGGNTGHAFANSAQYAPPSVAQPQTIEVTNNEEGIASYAPTTQNDMAAQMQDIQPASGGGLNHDQLENWELHRLQRFYNGEDGVTK
jgi:hypothetical protein